MAALLRQDRLTMLERMPATELKRWEIMERLEPFGVYGEWLRHGLLMALVASMFRKEGTAGPKPEEFIPETMRTGYVYEGDVDQEELGKRRAKQFFQMMMMVKAHQNAIVQRQKAEEEKRDNARNRRAARVRKQT